MPDDKPRPPWYARSVEIVVTTVCISVVALGFSLLSAQDASFDDVWRGWLPALVGLFGGRLGLRIGNGHGKSDGGSG